MLDFLKFEEVVEWDGNAFKEMKNLKTLIIRKGYFSEGPKHLPNSLRVLEWWRYPSPSLPSNFHQKKLVILKLPQSHSISIHLLMSNKEFVNMTVLNFDYCQCITEIPDVSGVPNLEELSFGHCENLIKIHKSVGFLNKLKILDAEGCKKFKSFPPIKLTSLEELHLSCCPSLENFPEILGKMEKIAKLKLSETTIKELPVSIQNLTQLKGLMLTRCGVVKLPRSISMMRELKLSVQECKGLLISKQDEGDAQVSSLVFENTIVVNLWECNISDEFIRKEFSGNWRDSTQLRNILYKKVSTRKCTSLKDLDLTLFPECLTTLFLYKCENLQEIRGISPNMRSLHATECPSLTSECRRMLLNEELHKEGGDKVFLLPETRIPEWFGYSINGSSISFWFRNKVPAISLCFAFRLKGNYATYRLNIEVNGISDIGEDFYSDCKAGDYTVLFDMKQEKFLLDTVLLEENKWNYVVCTISKRSKENKKALVIKQSGIHVFEQGSSMEDIQFTDPLLLEEEHGLVDMKILKDNLCST